MTALYLLSLAIAVDNSAKVPGPVLVEAERVVAYILGKAGVAVAWQESGAVLRLSILKLKPPLGLHGDTAGFAVLNTSYAGVSYPVVEETASSLEAEVSTILGAAIAHETGHLLLGSAHSRAGIMSVRLGREPVRMAARGELLFTPEQAERIRAEVVRRANAEITPHRM